MTETSIVFFEDRMMDDGSWHNDFDWGFGIPDLGSVKELIVLVHLKTNELSTKFRALSTVPFPNRYQL
jgi:hypothetical protein